MSALSDPGTVGETLLQRRWLYHGGFTRNVPRDKTMNMYRADGLYEAWLIWTPYENKLWEDTYGGTP